MCTNPSDCSFFLRFIVQKVCTACSRTSYRTFPLTNLNKYLRNDTSETGVNINMCKLRQRKILKQDTATSGKLIIDVYVRSYFLYMFVNSVRA
jgi:hypothetical protein